MLPPSSRTRTTIDCRGALCCVYLNASFNSSIPIIPTQSSSSILSHLSSEPIPMLASPDSINSSLIFTAHQWFLRLVPLRSPSFHFRQNQSSIYFEIPPYSIPLSLLPCRTIPPLLFASRSVPSLLTYPVQKTQPSFLSVDPSLLAQTSCSRETQQS